MATTTTNFGWTVPQSTDLVKDGATAISALGSGIDTSLVDLKGGTTGQILAKASNTDLDYTWTSPNPGDITGVTAGTGISGGGTSGDVTVTNSMATAIDAKGDLIVGTGADAFSRLAVGTNGQVLQADSTAATGLKWGTVGGGGKILQVVQGTTTTEVTNNTDTFADTTLSASIIPSATTSRIMILVTQNSCYKTNGNASNAHMFRIVRGSTSIWTTQFVGWTDSATKLESTYHFSYVDSPSTTSATTYKTQFRNFPNAAGVVVQESTAPSNIILLEIGA